ncbi:MAG: hypothetical protein ACYC7H_16390 [Chloroflexota bacterium]
MRPEIWREVFMPVSAGPAAKLSVTGLMVVGGKTGRVVGVAARAVGAHADGSLTCAAGCAVT